MQDQNQQLYYQTLVDLSKPIGERYQAIFNLKHIQSEVAIQLLKKAYPLITGSVLLAHQILYAMGQLQHEKLPLFREFLVEKVENQKENALSRHEAAEALANYFIEGLDQLFAKYVDSKCDQLKWTCQIAVQKVKHHELKAAYGEKYCGTREPAAPFTQQEFSHFLKQQNFEEEYKKKGFLCLLVKEEVSLFQKYRIMYYMRNLNTPQVIQTLCLLLSKQYTKTQTSLLKHEVCFILGQIGCDKYQHLVRQCIENEEEESIVRHQALAAVASQSKDLEYLNQFLEVKDQLIRESAEVAYFTIKYWSE